MIRKQYILYRKEGHATGLACTIVVYTFHGVTVTNLD